MTRSAYKKRQLERQRERENDDPFDCMSLFFMFVFFLFFVFLLELYNRAVADHCNRLLQT